MPAWPSALHFVGHLASQRVAELILPDVSIEPSGPSRYHVPLNRLPIDTTQSCDTADADLAQP